MWSGITFQRNYNSLTEWPVPGELGERWVHTLQIRLIVPTSPTGAARIIDARNDVDEFVFVSGSTWRSTASPGQLLRKQADGTWTWIEDGNTYRTFSATGVLTRIARSAQPQQSLTLAYDPLGRLSTATNDNGRRLNFVYRGGYYEFPPTGRIYVLPRLESISDDSGATLVSYQYDAEGRLTGATRPGGGTRVYHYAEPANLCIGGTGPCNVKEFRMLITGVTSESGVRFSDYYYDRYARAVRSVQAGGANDTSLSYQSSTETQVNRPSGEIQRYRFTTGMYRFPTAIEQRLPDNTLVGTQSWTYSTGGRIDIETDRKGVTRDYDHDSLGLEIKRIDAKTVPGVTGTPAQQRTTETTWDTTLRVPLSRTLKNAAGTVEQITRWAYNTRGQVTARCEVDPLNTTAVAYTCGASTNAPVGVRQTRTTYCEAGDVPSVCPLVGLVRQVDGPRTDVPDATTFDYRLGDEPTCATSPATCPWRKGDLWKVTNALGHVTESLRYDSAGRVTRMKDANGTLTDLTYHPRGWLLTRTVRANADGSPSTEDATTTIAYDAVGNVEKVTQPDGDFLRYDYDAANRLTGIRDSDTPGAGNRIAYTLDAAGQRTKEETFDASGTLKRRLARQFNALSQLRALVNAPYAAQANLDDPAVKKTTFTYDANGNQDLSTDPLNTVTDNDHDPLNRLIRSVGDKGAGAGDINATTQYTYDARDNLRTVVDPKVLTTRYTYDGLNNLTQLDSPDTGITDYGYDAAGNRLSQTDARSITASYSYDAQNRLTTITYPDSALNVGFAYDQSNAVTGCGTSFPLGRLTRITDASGTTTFCYDRRGNVTRKAQVTAGTSLVLDFTYTRADRLETLTYPGGGRARYGRDAQGRITAVWWRPAGSGTETPVVTSASWLPYGPLQSLTFGNGRTLTKTYDQNYWIDAVNGAPAGLSLDFGTDDVGNIVGLTVGAAANNRVYDYDDLNRLTSVVNGSAANVEAFSYDATGNRLAKQVGAGAAVPYTYPTTSHRLQSVGGVTRSYDAAGNTTQMPSMANAALTLVYDARNRLSRVDGTSGTVQANHYNGRGERVRKVAGAVDRRFVYDRSGRVLGEFDAGGVPQQLFVWMDDQPVAVVEGSALRYIETDHLNTPRALIDPARNVAVWRWDLNGSAFGEHAANEDPDADSTLVKFNLRFPGQYLDGETGLHYNYFRDYEAGTGRYVESDPIGLVAGVNTFAYVDSSPLRRVDVLGLSWEEGFVLGCGIGGGIGSTVGASVGAGAGGAAGLTCGPGAPVCVPAGAAGGSAAGAVILGGMGCAGGGIIGGLIGMCMESAKDCEKIKQECIRGCSDFVLKKPRRQRTDWGSGDDFFNCVRRCMDRNDC